LSQEATQGVVHRRLAVAGGVLQNPQIFARGDPCYMLALEPVVGHPKAAVGEQILSIPVVLERSRLAHQLVDDVPVVDRVLVPSHQPRHRVDQLAPIPDLDVLGRQTDVDLLANQAAVNRIHVAVDVDQASRVHTHRQPQTAFQSLERQRPENGEFFRVPLAPRRVPLGHQIAQKGAILVTAGEVSTATQQQRLIHRVLEVSVRRLGIAILVRLADIDPFASDPVVFQQAAIPALKLAFRRQVVDRRAEAVAPVPPGYAPELPERVLQAVGQCLERFRSAHAHRFPIRVCEHEVVQQMIKSLSQQRDLQRVHAREVGGRQVPLRMHLAEHHVPRGTGRGTPLLHATLERAAMAVQKPSRALPLEPVEQRLGLQPGFRLQTV
jgi:hypothetical protein